MTREALWRCRIKRVTCCLTLGEAITGVTIVVVHTYEELAMQEVIRIISARRATKKEKEQYEEGIPYQTLINLTLRKFASEEGELIISPKKKAVPF